MPEPVVKICCIRSEAEARMVAAAGAGLIGLVAAMPSGPGPIADARIAAIAAAAPEGVETVLLTAETEAAALAEHVARCRPSVAQLVDHGALGAHWALRKAHPGLTIMQVVHVEDEAAIDFARAAAETADALLFDRGRPAAGQLGGTGRRHDWAISRRIVEAAGRPAFLAGGLGPENVAEAIRAVRPHGVDICTGVRTAGALHAAKLAAFMAAVRAG